MNRIKFCVIAVLLAVSPFTLAADFNREESCQMMPSFVDHVIELEGQGVSKAEQLKDALEFEKQTGNDMEVVVAIINLVYKEIGNAKTPLERENLAKEMGESIYNDCMAAGD